MTSDHSPMAATPSPTAVTLAAEVNAIIQTTMDYVYAQEAAVMERLHQIRQEFADDESFARFIAHTTRLKPKDALSRVMTWQASRKSRDLRELAQRRPTELMQTIVSLADEDIAAVDRDDEVVQLMTLPPRKRHKAIRELIDRGRDAAAAPVDAAAVDDNVIPISAGQARTQLRDLSALSTQITSLLADISQSTATYTPAQTAKALALTDQLVGALEDVSGALLGGES